jgi:uncharacterized phage protein gp47/JayE
MIKTFSDLLDDLMSELVVRTPFTNLNPSAAIRGLLEVIAKVIADLYDLLKSVTAQSFVQTATGAWLDLKVREMGIVRHPALKARVRLTFSRSTPADRNITIPAGTICKSVKDSSGRDFRFFTTSEAVLEEGESSVMVEAEAESPGADWNVGEGMVTRLVTKIAGVESVVNHPESLLREGSDSESDENLRSRAIGAWECLGLGGTREAYRTWALSVPGVAAASVLDDFPFGPGTVGVVILGSTGAPTPALLADVLSYIKERKPLTADVRVLGPRMIIQNITIEATHFAGVDQTAVESAILESVERFSKQLQLGEGLVITRLTSLLMDIPGIYNVRVTLPTCDVSIGLESFLDIGEVTILHRIKGRSYQDAGIASAALGVATAGDQISAVNKTGYTLGE